MPYAGHMRLDMWQDSKINLTSAFNYRNLPYYIANSKPILKNNFI
jgi:hypothetical protein